MSDDKIQQISIIEQSLNQAVTQKQQYDKLLLDINSALEALENTKEAYQIVGTIMIKKGATEIASELQEKKERYEVRVQSLHKQEEQLRDRMQKLQDEILSGMNTTGAQQ